MHDCVGLLLGGGVQHTDGPLQVKYGGGPDPCDPCGVDAYDYSLTLLKSIRPNRRLRQLPITSIYAF